MRTLILIATTAAITAAVVCFLHEPETKIVQVERIRTVVAPPALKLPNLQASDEKLATQVKINRDTMKRMTIGTWYKDKFSKDIQEFL